MGRKGTDFTGKRFGKLVVIEPIEGLGVRGRWRCKCDCGNETIVFGSNLGKSTISCGCYAREASSKRNSTHHKSKSRLFPIWQSMKQRCENPKAHAYPNYGGRGIKVCEEWSKSFTAFEEWAFANGYDENAPKGKCTIDRIDNDGNYEPNNCRWADSSTQQNNKRVRVELEWDGRKMSVAEWSKETGLTHSTILRRIRRGWSVGDALTTAPLRNHGQTNNH